MSEYKVIGNIVFDSTQGLNIGDDGIKFLIDIRFSTEKNRVIVHIQPLLGVRSVLTFELFVQIITDTKIRNIFDESAMDIGIKYEQSFVIYEDEHIDERTQIILEMNNIILTADCSCICKPCNEIKYAINILETRAAYRRCSCISSALGKLETDCKCNCIAAYVKYALTIPDKKLLSKLEHKLINRKFDCSYEKEFGLSIDLDSTGDSSDDSSYD